MLRRIALRLALVMLGAVATGSVRAEPPVSEAAVKAAFVYNFAKFIEWPPEVLAQPQDPIRVCLYGNPDPFLAALIGIDGKQAQNHPVRVQRVARPAEFAGCHMVVIGESESRHLAETVRTALDQGSLILGEIEGFTDAGGTIGLGVDNDRVAFDVNLEAARRANIKLSSQVLKLARRVRR
ncbi:MAG TPA: YfiR family protein [Rhodocyclaceae bacterium]|nr:YfiR family protein [Rhodocyclaceae bacterium]